MEIDGEGSIFDDEFNPTVSYSLKFPLNIIKHKKIPYTNREDYQVTLKLSSSN
jgi:hypothetical protein